MTIDDLKRALVEVRTICKKHADCNGCPFDKNSFYCSISERPDRWKIDDWEEDTHETD